MAGPLGVTHFLVLSKTDSSVYLVSGHHAFPPPRPQLLLSSDEPPALSCSDAGFKVNALKRWSKASPLPYPEPEPSTLTYPFSDRS